MASSSRENKSNRWPQCARCTEYETEFRLLNKKYHKCEKDQDDLNEKLASLQQDIKESKFIYTNQDMEKAEKYFSEQLQTQIADERLFYEMKLNAAEKDTAALENQVLNLLDKNNAQRTEISELEYLEAKAEATLANNQRIWNEQKRELRDRIETLENLNQEQNKKYVELEKALKICQAEISLYY